MADERVLGLFWMTGLVSWRMSIRGWSVGGDAAEIVFLQ